jgi:hypothetical protein
MKRSACVLRLGMGTLGCSGREGLFVVLHGTAPQADEGAAAHVWQLMAGQIPFVMFFTIRWVQQAPRQGGADLGVTGRLGPGGNGARLHLPLVDRGQDLRIRVAAVQRAVLGERAPGPERVGTSPGRVSTQWTRQKPCPS